MKQISGFSVIGINNGMRLTYTYDEIDRNGGLISQNVRKSLYIVDDALKEKAESIFDFIEKIEKE